MDWLDAIPANLQGYATAIFVVAMAVLAAYFNRRGANEKDKVHEFAVAGQLADMGPVKELVEGVGLLIQQQVRTNIALEACAVALSKAANSYDGQLRAAQTQEEVEERAQALFERRLAQEREADGEPRRRVPRKTE